MIRNAYFAILILVAFASRASAAVQPLSIEKYWAGFKTFWVGNIGSIGGVVGIVLATGVVGIFIITRGKWMK